MGTLGGGMGTGWRRIKGMGVGWSRVQVGGHRVACSGAWAAPLRQRWGNGRRLWADAGATGVAVAGLAVAGLA